jgi:hypothetical protein
MRPLVAILIALLLLLYARPVEGALSPRDMSYPSDSTIAWKPVRVGPGQSLESLCGEAWPDVARFNRMDRRHAWPGTWIRMPLHLEQVASFQPLPTRYVPADSLPRFVLLDLSEQFLGAYEFGRLAFSVPVASGRRGFETPTGRFTIDFADARHVSSKYDIEGTGIPYPMDWALRFHTSRSGIAYWIHSRDLPGVPASHGCVGVTDERMQKRVYGMPRDPVVEDSRRLYAWAGGPEKKGPIAPIPLLIVARTQSGAEAIAASE